MACGIILMKILIFTEAEIGPQSKEILYHKGLYQQALKLTKKASELAKENDLFIQELAVREIEAELMSKQFLYTDAIQNIERSEKVMQVAQNFNAIQKTLTTISKKENVFLRWKTN